MKKLVSYWQNFNNYQTNLVCAATVLIGVIWLSTGTLSPYALVAPIEMIQSHCTSISKTDSYTGAAYDSNMPGLECRSQCRYIGNIDHEHFQATFFMLDGANKSSWDYSVVLRRGLFPIIAYPFMKLTGYETGGILTSFLLHFLAFLYFVNFIKHEIGENAAIITAWLLATFPGVAYFGGLPYSYSFIFPGTLIISTLLWQLAKVETVKSIFLVSLGVGIIFTGYDFLPIFGFAAFLIMIRRKLFIGTIFCLAGMLIPTVIFTFLLKYYYGAPLLNSNNAMYGFIAFSYLGIVQSFMSGLIGIDPNSSIGAFLNKNAPPPDLAQWFELIKPFPIYLLHNFLFSTFFYLSAVFALLNLPKIFGQRLKLNRLEWSIILSVFLLFAFNNLAPPYRSWQMRGFEFDRIYEPVFIAFVFYLARKVQSLPELPIIKQRILFGLIYLVIMGNAVTSFSTLIPNKLGLGIYVNFYISNNTTELFIERINKYGKYPIGFCAPMNESEDSPKAENQQINK